MRRALTAVLLAALLLPVVVVAPAAGATTYRMNLFRSGDFASQVTTRTCVGASIQMMVNMDGPNDGAKATQLRYWQLARALGNSRFGGANATGWAGALSELGDTRYVVDFRWTLREAITHAAMVMRETGRPVGLLTWRGAHAWVMHGFEATADPSRNPKARVTAVYISDPWYPRVSSGFGRSPEPNSKLTIAQLGRDYLPWDRRRTNPEKDGRYFLVLPAIHAWLPGWPGPAGRDRGRPEVGRLLREAIAA